MDPIFVKGVLATVFSFAVFIGTIWLVMAMVLGPKMGYLVLGSVFFGLMVILGAMWFMNALGPKGPETTWHAIGVGKDLSEVEGFRNTFDVSDFPGGAWEVPKRDRRLADQKPRAQPCLSLIRPCASQDTRKESKNVTPVLETLVSQAVSPIPGKRKEVKDEVQGAVDLAPGKFSVTDLRMKEATVDGKPSLIAMGRAVPSDNLVAEALDGASEGKVTRYVTKPGDRVSAGDPVLLATADGKTLSVNASQAGRVIQLGLRPGDKVKPGVPIAKVDVSGQPGQPDPAEVVAVRVRGGVRTPAFFYLVAALILFAIHMAALARAEKAPRATAQPV